jgi:LacI family transcriptional regulator, galactose operon repressor
LYISLKDVAARAGVSFQTASKVLNGRPGVAAPATAERIRTAAQELGYVPNGLARGLVRSGTITIGILTDDLADGALSHFVAGAQAALAARGHAAVLVAIRPEIDAGESLHKVLEHRVDGLLIIAPSLEQNTSFSGALRDGLPLVSLSHLPGTSAVLLGSDHRVTGKIAASHLIDLGHRAIATVTGPPQRQVVRLRRDAFRNVLDEAGVALPSARVDKGDWSAGDGYHATGRILDRDPTVTAIFVHSDEMAVGALRLLADRNISVPDRFSVIGCDDLPLSRFLVPSLTTIHVPFTETGARAAALLLDLIAGRSAPRRELLPVHLVQRQSTGPPPRSRGRPQARPASDRRPPPLSTSAPRKIRSTPASTPAKEPST